MESCQFVCQIFKSQDTDFGSKAGLERFERTRGRDELCGSRSFNWFRLCHWEHVDGRHQSGSFKHDCVSFFPERVSESIFGVGSTV